MFKQLRELDSLDMIHPKELESLHPLLKAMWMQKISLKILGINKLNRIYARLQNVPAHLFLRTFLADRGVVYRYNEKDLTRIPSTGAVVIACNHPLGALDGLIVLELIQKIRPDVKILGHRLLHRIEPLRPHLLTVNPMEGRFNSTASSLSGLRGALDWLEKGHVVIVFPAAEVSRIQLKSWKIEDRPYPEGVIRFLKKTNAPTVPVHFFGRNRWTFYLASLLLGPWSSGLLLREALRVPKVPFELRIGKAHTFESGEDLRKRIYRLQRDRRYIKSLWHTIFLPPRSLPDVAPVSNPEQLREAVNKHLSRNEPLVCQGDLIVFSAYGDEIPGLIETLGSLRETSFRLVGEGSGMPLDVDRFDATYHHLILWHKTKSEIWGAYRLGLGAEILPQYSKKGLYINAFFRIKKAAIPLLQKTVEMGRAFLVPEAQQKPLPLYLLWRGILAFAQKDPKNRRFLMGCVSISNRYSSHSQRFMLGFVKTHFLDAEMSLNFKPKKPFLLHLSKADKEYLAKSTPLDLKSFDRLLEEVEPGGLKLPILLKKYLGQNARVLAFNRDPDFNTVDALLYVDTESLDSPLFQSVES